MSPDGGVARRISAYRTTASLCRPPFCTGCTGMGDELLLGECPFSAPGPAKSEQPISKNRYPSSGNSAG